MNNRSQLPYRTFPAALASLALSATATIALAQSQQDDMDYDESSDTLEEIVVTAQRREENLKDVPIAITALDASQMERLGIGNINDLQPYVPNLVLSRNTGTANGARIYLRGVGEDESRATVEPGIPLYIDGVYYGRAIGSLVDLLDVEQMEVLRGPQGTLYGRNSNGGAIRLQTRAPDSDKFSANVGGTIGSYALTDIKASANIPVSDNGGLRLSFLSRTRDGIFETTETETVTGGEDIGAYDVTSYRLTYKHDTDNLKVTVSADGVTDNSEPRPPNALPDNADDVYELAGGYNVNDFYKSNVESSGFSAAVEWQSGDFTFRSLTASRSLQDDLQTVIAFPYTQETDQSQFSEELQVVSNWDSNFNFVAGLFIFQEDIKLPFTYIFPFDLTVDTSATALFGQGTYDLNEQLRLTFGLRNTSESKSFSGANSAFMLTRDQDRDWSHSTHKLAVNYDIDDSSSIYASNSSGFRSGAWSPDAFSGTATFLPVDEETVTTTEFGYRGLLSNDKLRLYATYFLSDYDDLQLSGTTSAGFTRFNISAAEISGLEIELTALLMPNLQLRATLATLDAEFTDLDADGAIGLGALASADLAVQDTDVPADVTLPAKPGTLADDATDDQKAMHEAATKAYNDAVESDPTAIAARDARVAEGIALGLTRRLKNTPESSFTLGLFYEKQIGSGLELNLSGDLANEAESYSLSANPDDLKREATTLLNLRVGVSKPEVWDAAFWIKNATDEVYYPAAVSALGGSVYAADPMTWGIDFRYRF